jgi:hypothetical protein
MTIDNVQSHIPRTKRSRGGSIRIFFSTKTGVPLGIVVEDGVYMRAVRKKRRRIYAGRRVYFSNNPS